MPTLQILLCAVVTHSLLSVKVCLGLAIFCVLSCGKSWSTVSNSPGALCRISSSVAGLIPGERTSATPRSVLQISDHHLRRFPIRSARGAAEGTTRGQRAKISMRGGTEDAASNWLRIFPKQTFYRVFENIQTIHLGFEF